MLTRLMPDRRQLIALPLLIAGLAGPATAQPAGYSPEVERLLARALAATGGRGWYQLRGWREAGTRGGRAYQSWIDPLRYGLRTETHEPGGLSLQGFNGQAEWRISPTGQITAVNDRETLAKARTEAFFMGQLYYFPGRFDARGEYLGVKRAGDRDYEVTRIQPVGGEPRELWFERGSGRLGRIVDRTGGKAVALRVSDYRKVGALQLPFRFTPEGRGAEEETRARDSISLTPLEREGYSLDRPKELARVAAARKD